MIGKGKFKATTDLYDYLVHGTTGATPFEVITEKEIGSVMERLEWIKNSLRRGTGAEVPENLSLWSMFLTHDGSMKEDFEILFWYADDISDLLGDINARTYLPSLLAILGWADVAGVQTLEQRLGYQTSGSIETAVGSVATDVNNLQVPIKFPSAEALNDIAVTAATDTTEKTITVSLPTGTSIVRVMLAAFITAMNNTANAQKIDIDVKGRKGTGTWSTFFSQDDVMGFPAADGATTGIVPLQDVTALVDAATSYGFKCTITQSATQSVRYTTQYVLIVTYKMS